MKHPQILSVLLLALLFSSRTYGGQYPERTINKAVKIAEKTWSGYQGEKDILLELEPLDPDGMGQYLTRYDTLFMILDGSSEPLGYLVLSSGMGRFERFDFMILYTLEKKLLEIRVLTYRSEHGSQITSKAWLRKFVELGTEKEIRYGEDIDALSGATYSASSITTEVNRLNKLIRETDK